MKDEELFGAAARQATGRMRDFNPQNVANTVWAFATLGVKDEELLRAAARRATERIRQFNPQNVANTVWALTTLGVREEELMRAAVRPVSERIREMLSGDCGPPVWRLSLDSVGARFRDGGPLEDMVRDDLQGGRLEPESLPLLAIFHDGYNSGA